MQRETKANVNNQPVAGRTRVKGCGGPEPKRGQEAQQQTEGEKELRGTPVRVREII